MDVTIIERITESSPVVVLIALFACVILWRDLKKKDDMLMALQRETLTALGEVSAAMRDLRATIAERERHH